MSDFPGPAVHRLGGCQLDLERGTLRRNGTLVPLRAKSFGLLAHLARNAGRVVSKEELLDAIWPGVTVTEDSLTQAVRDVRKALGDESQLIVRTVARRGYVLVRPEREVVEAREPRVAMLPLRNATGNPDDGVLLDGLVEEITNGLARFRTLAVIARHSAFAFPADARPDLAEVAAQLGADYLVDGTARRAGGRLEVTVAINDVRQRRQLWGHSYAADRDDLLALREDVPRQIVARLVSNIEGSVIARSAAAPIASLSAFEHFTRARDLLRQYGEGVNERGRDHLLRAIEIDPGFGLAHGYLALADVLIADLGLAPRAVLEDARDRAMRAIRLAPEESRCYWIAGFIRSLLDEHAGAEQTTRRAVEINPYDADGLCLLGEIVAGRGRAAEGLALMDRAIALNPLHPDWYHADRSLALYLIGRYEEAAAVLECLPQLTVRQETRMAATLAMAGRAEEAARFVDRAEARVPGWDHAASARSYHLERAEDIDHLLRGVEAALAAREARLQR